MNNTNDMASYYFHQGTNYFSYNFLGCNISKKEKQYIYTFRTWAPNADSVALVSDFSGWDNPIYMNKITDRGIYEYIHTSDCSLENSAYKFQIIKNGNVYLKGDPYAKYSRGGADGASIVYSSKFKWSDKNWLTFRKKTIKGKKNSYLPTPINIYEVHLGSFLRHEDDNSYYTYRELADVLVPYVKHMGYTHVEFLPITEYPFDGSWGYQVCGFYAPTSRYGSPDDFKYLINSFHKNGIGVIIDWVPAHFPKDAWGLYEFDGAPLYEYQGDDRKESKTWGTRFFDLGREEIQSFLISSALYFLREFHIDGIRVDAVASMIYLDYDKDAWLPNVYGTNSNLEAVAFLQKLNTAIFAEFSDVLMIAEESGSYNGITHKTDLGGLGFNLKWNMGWANDMYDYVLTDPCFRKYKHNALTFPIMYAFNENYVLPVSHDEVVHGKLSLVNKMYGAYEDKFPQMRTFLLMMMTYPGKKLMFMGTEYAQFREWDYENALEFFMLDYPNHRAMRDYVAALNKFYLENPELWEIDFNYSGFKWILADEAEKNTIAYKRVAIKGTELTVMLNFSGTSQVIQIPKAPGIDLKPIFNTGVYVVGEPEFKIDYSEDSEYATVTLPKFYGAVLKECQDNKIINI